MFYDTSLYPQLIVRMKQQNLSLKVLQVTGVFSHFYHEPLHARSQDVVNERGRLRETGGVLKYWETMEKKNKPLHTFNSLKI